MTGSGELSLRLGGKYARLGTALAALGAIGAGVAAGLGVPESRDWAIISAVTGAGVVMFALGFRRRLEAGPDGVRFRTILRWHRLEWDEIIRFEDLRVQPPDRRRISEPSLRVAARLRGDALVWLPVPYLGAVDIQTFEKQLSQLRALHRRHAHRTPTP